MSNPYDPYNDASGNPEGGDQGNQPPPPPPYGGAEQGGQAPPPPHGQPPYGQPPYGDSPYGQTPFANEAPKSTDPVSIIGFILSLTCCLSIVGAIMGAIGLRRTKNGQRRGRWAAISGLIIGVLGTLAFAGIIVAVVFFAKNVVTVDNAEAGQCVDVTQNDDIYSFLKKDCSEQHEAEIVFVGQASDYDGDLAGTIDPVAVCTALMPAEDIASLRAYPDDLTFSLIVTDPEDISPSDAFFCYVEPRSGKLSSPLL